MIHHRLLPLSLGGLLLLGHVGTVQALDDAYLSAVKADLQEFTTGEFAIGDNPWGQAASGSADGTASLDDFSNFVKEKFRGTYILYSRLPTWKKTQIWQEYVNTGDLGGIRTNIYAARSNDSKPQRSSITNLPLDF